MVHGKVQGNVENKIMKATIDDIKQELWLRLREKKHIVWETKDGQQIPIQDLSDTHLINIIDCCDGTKYDFQTRLEQAIQSELLNG